LKINGTSIDDKWIGYNPYLKKLVFTPSNILGGVTPTDLSSSAYSSNIPNDFDLQDHGTEFRMAPNNLNHGPKILQHISRNFFSGSYSVDEFVFQDALLPQSSNINFVSLAESASASGFDMTNNQTNSYKLSPVYDGIQELPLDTASKSITTTATSRMNQIKFTLSASVSGTAPNKTYGFNPRMTAIKVYRETSNSGTYFHIGTIPINTKTENDNVLPSTTNYKKGIEAVYSDSFIDDSASLTGSGGTFATFDCGSIGTAGSTVVSIFYYVCKKSESLVNESVDAGSVLIKGFPIFAKQSNSGTSQNVTSTPSTDSTFVSNLQNGIINTVTVDNDVSTGHNPVDFFDEECVIVIIKGLAAPGQSTNFSVVSSLDVSIGACHSNQLVFNGIANADRYSASQYNSGFLVKGNNHYLIQGTLGKAVLINNATSGFGSAAVQIFKSYIEGYASNTATYYFYDMGFTAGAQQPYVEDAKVRVHYKFSQMLNDRLFVGNVKLDPSVDNEDHPDWLIYSAPGMPDVLPIVNYIQIKDQQGGTMMALNKLLDSLVVFMSRGTFRLDVNSVGDPSSWQLMESNSHIGCIASKAVVNIKDNLFFCSHDAVYQITPDFRFTPISEPIKDVYQSASNLSQSRLMYDVKRNRLLCSFGSTTDTIYAYDLISNGWSTLKFGTVPAKFYSIDDSLDVFGFYHQAPDNSGDAVNSTIYSLHQSSSSESMDIVYQTGFKNITKMDKNAIVRRLNLNYESSAALTCKLYSDGDMTTVRSTLTFSANNSSKDYLVSIRPSGIRASSLALKISATTSAAVKINKVEIETDE